MFWSTAVALMDWIVVNFEDWRIIRGYGTGQRCFSSNLAQSNQSHILQRACSKVIIFSSCYLQQYNKIVYLSIV